MIIKTNFKLGDNTYQVEVEEKSELDTLHKIIVLSSPRKYCAVCKKEVPSEELYFTTNKDKEGNVYVNVKHKACGSRSKLGQYKTGGYFWHEYEKYEPKNKKEVSEPVITKGEEDVNPDSIPF